MKLKWSAIRAERLTNDRVGSGWEEASISLKQCWISGTTRRASITRFALMTGSSIFFDNKRLCPMARGIWFHVGRMLTVGQILGESPNVSFVGHPSGKGHLCEKPAKLCRS
jgi:hypothetical protein